MMKNSILGKDLDKKESFTRVRVTEALSSNMYALVKTLSDELEELGYDPVTMGELMIAVEGVMYILYQDKHEEEETKI